MVDLEVQGLLRQNENGSQKIGMWSSLPLLLNVQLERAVVDKFQPAKGMEMKCHNAYHEKSFVSHPPSRQPEAQPCAGIGLCFKCTVYYLRPQAEKATFSSEAVATGSIAFSPCMLHFLPEPSVKTRLKIMSSASMLHNEMLATRCCSCIVTHSPASHFLVSFCSG